MRKNTYAGKMTLRDYHGTVVTVECRVCAPGAKLDRKALVKQYGADCTFLQLRRRLTLGCSRMNTEDGVDRGQTHFPCLLAAGLSCNKEDIP
ncbi:hypothetical protein [Rhizobium leguminosarum]|uniref:hypothetical protein n=1 Tax=Rhizobium leguminosarum TaxID=384 RepID=UPI001FE127C2|nr:hypothetical protein [Rhizobium leguminosarum]